MKNNTQHGEVIPPRRSNQTQLQKKGEIESPIAGKRNVEGYWFKCSPNMANLSFVQKISDKMQKGEHESTEEGVNYPVRRVKNGIGMRWIV